MPTATRQRRSLREAAPAAEEQTPVAVSTETPAPFDPFDETVPFMNAIDFITDEEWQKYWLYLYRLDPKVKNSATTPTLPAISAPSTKTTSSRAMGEGSTNFG